MPRDSVFISRLSSYKPIAALLFSASMWAVVWYPYRILAQAGIQGPLAMCWTYAVGMLAMTLYQPQAWRGMLRHPVSLGLVGLTAGLCNVCYVLGVLQGEVMRVLLLFYLAPLWTIILARLILNESIGRTGYLVLALAFGGAVAMLWDPQQGLPIPSDMAEWLGLAGGLSFAFESVFSRQVPQASVMAKALAIFAGVVVVSLGALLALPLPWTLTALSLKSMGMMAAIGLVLTATSVAFQYGLSFVSAPRAIVILLFELVVAATSSYLLAHEVMSRQEWIGGAMIVVASLFSRHMEARPSSSRQAPATP